MGRELVIGSSLYDVCIKFPLDNEQGIEVTTAIGGKGLNIAWNLRKLNVPVDLISPVGIDNMGKHIQSRLDEADIPLLPREDEFRPNATGVFICLLRNGELSRYLTEFTGAPQLENYLRSTVDWTRYSWVITDTSQPEYVYELLSQVKSDNGEIKIGIEASSRSSVAAMRDVSSIVDYFVANEAEGLILAESMGIDTIDDLGVRLNNSGVDTVLITRGNLGAVVYKEGNKYEQPAVQVDKPIVSTIGAGDSVTATFFALYYQYGLDIATSLRLSMMVASDIVRQDDPKILTLSDELKTLINEGKLS
jgi:pseudouridine kinase